MKRVAVLGGGPAGAVAAERLAAAGLEVRLYDERLAWEKPCGGGVTYKAYSQYPFLRDNDAPKRLIAEITLGTPRAGSATLSMPKPLLVYSRYDLNRMLLDRAERAGAQLEMTRVLSLERSSSGWRIRTKSGDDSADFCIVATGARNPLRGFGTRLQPYDTMAALGYYVPGAQSGIDIQVLPPLEGYIWVFPRCNHLSVGICGKGESAANLRRRLETFMQERGIPLRDAIFYSHLLPSLDRRSWKGNNTGGDGWLAVGDAAGLVDPITGEGIYYAIRSAGLASETVLTAGGDPAAYCRRLREDFAADLELGATLSRRIYSGRFLLQPVWDRIVEFSRRSPHFSRIVLDLLAGNQSYTSLKRRLWRSLPRTLLEMIQ